MENTYIKGGGKMKKRVFRERYNMVNGNGEILKEGLTVEDISKMKIAEDENAGTINISKVEIVEETDVIEEAIKEIVEESVEEKKPKKPRAKKEVKEEPKKRGRKKSVKSDK